jgi:hypothetical protein
MHCSLFMCPVRRHCPSMAFACHHRPSLVSTLCAPSPCPARRFHFTYAFTAPDRPSRHHTRFTWTHDPLRIHSALCTLFPLLARVFICPCPITALSVTALTNYSYFTRPRTSLIRPLRTSPTISASHAPFRHHHPCTHHLCSSRIVSAPRAPSYEHRAFSRPLMHDLSARHASCPRFAYCVRSSTRNLGSSCHCTHILFVPHSLSLLLTRSLFI